MQELWGGDAGAKAEQSHTSGLMKAASTYSLSGCCKVKTHLHKHAEQEWLLLW